MPTVTAVTVLHLQEVTVRGPDVIRQVIIAREQPAITVPATAGIIDRALMEVTPVQGIHRCLPITVIVRPITITIIIHAPPITTATPLVRPIIRAAIAVPDAHREVRLEEVDGTVVPVAEGVADVVDTISPTTNPLFVSIY